MARDLKNSVVIITGASAGIGKALAEQLHAQGCRLSLAARRIDRLESLNLALGGAHLCVQTDVSRPEDCKMLIDETVERFGRIDTLVCNAGYGLVRRVDEMTPAELQAILATNVFGTTEPIRHAVPILKRNQIDAGWRGQILIVSSAAARRGLPFFGAYAATKAAQLSLSEAARVELMDDRIAVTSVHPIGTTTEFIEAAETVSAKAIESPKRTPYRQSAETVAKAIVKAMKKPRPEVWPMRPSRWGLAFASLVPSISDRVMRRSYRDIAAHQARLKTPEG
jgi:short-subunit dehydrogenase